MKTQLLYRNTRLAIATIGLASVLVLGGCTSSTVSWDQSAGDSTMEFSSQAGSGAPMAQTAALDSVAMGKDLGVATVPAALIKSGDAWIIVKDPAAAATKFSSLVESLGGRIDSTWQSDHDNSFSSSVTARVPADKFDELRGQLSDFGKISNESTYVQDVGQEVADLDARKAALETSIERLETLMKDATTTEDLLQAEDMMTQRQAELDSLTSQLQWLNGQVDMSSLNVTFATEAGTTSDGFSWGKAWDLLVNSFIFVLYFVVVVGPWILIAGLIALIVVLLVRRRRKARRSSAAEAPTEPTEEPASSGSPESRSQSSTPASEHTHGQ